MACSKLGRGKMAIWRYGISASHGSCRLGGFVAVLSDFFFFQAEDGIRDLTVTGVQTCALPIWTIGRLSQQKRQTFPCPAETQRRLQSRIRFRLKRTGERRCASGGFFESGAAW